MRYNSQFMRIYIQIASNSARLDVVVFLFCVGHFHQSLDFGFLQSGAILVDLVVAFRLAVVLVAGRCHGSEEVEFFICHENCSLLEMVEADGLGVL